MGLKHAAFYLLRRGTSMAMRQQLKERAWSLRVKAAPLLRAWIGTYDTRDLEVELARRLPGDFEILMVHSSISNMFPMYRDTAGDLLKLLLRMTGHARTLAMPAFFFGTPERFNREYYRCDPVFDVRRTPSQMGLVSELFRRRKGVLRSLHPTHSVCALGPLAKDLTCGHHLSPLMAGRLSPFGVMGRHKTVILGLGVEYYRTLTQVHAVEDALGPDFPVPRQADGPVAVTLIDAAGLNIPYELPPPLSADFTLKIERLERFIDRGALAQWKFVGTTLFQTTASEIDRSLAQAAARGESLYVSKTVARKAPGRSVSSEIPGSPVANPSPR
jgi:aminoglycoside 3-N-acetyltransferase